MPRSLSGILSVFSLAAVAFAASESHVPTVSSAWYAGWHIDDGAPISSISWDKYTRLTFAFAETTPDVNTLSFVRGTNESTLQDFVAAAHENGVNASVSIGGWTGSRFFSSMVDSAENRTAFVNTIVTFAKQYELDGVDFDWEYPNRQGLGCNAINSDDTANFLLLLQELRKDPLGATLTLTAAASIGPWNNINGTASVDVSGFAAVLDYVVLMNYDIWGGWSTAVGPNAPLVDSCAIAANQQGSGTGAVAAWTAAGMPANQIVLGVPTYGHSFRVYRQDAFIDGGKKLKAYPAFNATDKIKGDKWDDDPPVDLCGNPSPPGGGITFWGLMDLGYLNKQGKPNQNIAYRYDSCSQTPYVYNNATEIMVSFDNAQSFAAKGAFIKQQGLLGFAMWESEGDYNDILIDSIRGSAGIETEPWCEDTAEA